MSNENDFVLSDEAIAEQEKTTASGEDLRAGIVEELGLTDDEDNKPVIDKFVEREQKLRAGYGELLGKKYIPLKKAYQELTSDPRLQDENKGTPKDFDPDKFREEVQKDTVKNLNEQYLDETDYTDEFKQKVREELGRNPGKTVQSVLKNSDYLKFYKDKEDQALRAAEAANNGTGQSGTKKNDGVAMPEKFNDPKFMITPEGQKEFDEWSKSNK